ncbi:RICIN domain-containing protein [Streptomyces melanogenes]|uniref:RICIN domain-containing protein n=1 Tax=Streptomyces melanogenes TaxID=67326 RepID=UPI0037B410E9
MPKLTAHRSRPNTVDMVPVEIPDEAVISLASHPSLVFDMAGASKEAGAGVILWNLHRQANQRWRIRPTTNSPGCETFHLVNVHSGLCLALYDDDRTAPITQTPVEDGNHQQWWMLDMVEGGFAIRHARLLTNIAPEEVTAGKPLRGVHGREKAAWAFTAA